MTYYKNLFDLKVDADTRVRVYINECKVSGHVQQVAYSVHHEVLTQLCFTCKIIRTSMPKDTAYLGLASKEPKMFSRSDILVDGINRLTRKLNEIILENEKALLLLKDRPDDRLVEGKLLAYKKCSQLIEVYLS